jgi:hypothetical protein
VNLHQNREETGIDLGRVQTEAGVFCPLFGLACRKRVKDSNMRQLREQRKSTPRPHLAVQPGGRFSGFQPFSGFFSLFKVKPKNRRLKIAAKMRKNRMRKPFFLRLFAAIPLAAVVWIGQVAQACGVKARSNQTRIRRILTLPGNRLQIFHNECLAT